MLRTSWSRDPWARGSYSYLPVGATPEDRVRLRRPLGERVFWAGEATASASPATVHGAIASGRRAAAEVRAAASADDRVIVIGAGAAGLAAAVNLDEEGFDVVVVEARERIGGRIDTARPGGWAIPIERGAAWVHDAEGNVLGGLLAEAEVETAAWDWNDMARLGAGGRIDGPDGRRSMLADAVARAVEGARTRGGPDESVARALARSSDSGRLPPAVVARLLEAELSNELGASPRRVSARWGLEEGTEGDDLLVLGGFDALARAAAEGLRIRRQSPVTAVRWRAPGVAVDLAGGASLPAERVIVTVPLGVLKAGGIAFDPPLPPATSQAIARLGMGLLDKVFLRFDEPFWDEETAVWSLEEEAPFAEWYNLEPLTGEPVLFTLIGGGSGHRLGVTRGRRRPAGGRHVPRAVRGGGMVTGGLTGPSGSDPLFESRHRAFAARSARRPRSR